MDGFIKNWAVSMSMNWQNYDPEWLVRLAEQQMPWAPWLSEALSKCTRYSAESDAYYPFVSPENPNQPGSEWQFDNSYLLSDKAEGTIVIDILKGNRVGGVEFPNRLPKTTGALPEHPDFDYLDFTFATFGRPEIDENSIRVKVWKLAIGKGFPGYDQEKYYEEATLVLEGVVSSVRQLHLYTRTVKLSGIRKNIVDGPFSEVKEPVYSFPLDSFCYDPAGCLSWGVVAASVRVEDLHERARTPHVMTFSPDAGPGISPYYDKIHSLLAILSGLIRKLTQRK